MLVSNFSSVLSGNYFHFRFPHTLNIRREPGQALARYIGGGKHPQNPGDFFGILSIDLQDSGPGMVAEFQGAKNHARNAQVGDKGPAADRSLPGLVFILAAANALVRIGRGGLLPGQYMGGMLDGFHNFDVARAAAQVQLQSFQYFLAIGMGIVLQQDLGAHQKTGRTETALHGPLFYKSVSQAAPQPVG